ncbi:MAG: flippase-like domain-containing protein [Odoribacteraceae bacterium]|nr:flippase-like domain-containing protein [Odoribacteraceae bacterium]
MTKQIRVRKVIYPILIGLVVVSYMLYRDFDPNTFDLISFTRYTLFWLVIAFSCMIVRDIGYIVRIRTLSGNRLSWKQAFRVIMLWEFTSAITPSAVGGTTLAILFVHKEGIGVGKSSAMVMAASFLDELYFVLMFPIILLTVNRHVLYAIPDVEDSVTQSLFLFAIIGYGLKLSFLALLSYGLFRNPRGLKYLLVQLFRWRILRKWRRDVNEVGYDIIRNSIELKHKPFSFWLKTFAATFCSWTARYWVVNSLLVAFWFERYDWAQHFLIFARQLVMWIIMLIAPTPGGSGFAEFLFAEYFAEFLPVAGVAVAMALLWRLISYYPYLIIGVWIVPRWLARSFGKR